MLLHPDAARRFIDGYKSVLLEIHARMNVPRSQDLLDDLAKARGLAKAQPTALTDALAALKADGRGLADDVEQAIVSMRIARWVYLRSTTRHAIFIDHDVTNAYAVLALTNPIDAIVGGSGVTFEAGVFEFMGRYVCDGIVQSPVFLGAGYKGEFNTAYACIRREGRFHMKAASELVR